MQATSLLDTSVGDGSRSAPRVLLGALALALATQGLFFQAGLGLDWLVWDLAMIGVTLAVLGRGRLRAPAIATSVACAVLGAAFVMRRSSFTTCVALPANLTLLVALPVIVADDLSFTELGSVPRRLLALLGVTPSALFSAVCLPSDALSELERAGDGNGRHVVRRAAAGLALGLPLAGFFTLLLCADAGFAHVVSRVEARVTTLVSFGVHVLFTAAIYAVGHALFTRRKSPEPRPVVAIDAPYRTNIDPSLLPRVSPLTWGIVLAQVALVFFVYVLVHRDTQFGGHDLVRETRAITYSNHLHAGFYQLLLATVLAVALVVLGHRLLRHEPQDCDPRVPGGLPLSVIESALLVLTGLTLVSCAHRLRLYEEAYGATQLRIGVAFVGLVAFTVLLCTLAKAVFRGFRAFGASALSAATACALAASLFDADGYIAKSNLDRAARGMPLDQAYLHRLSADACVAADHPVLLRDPLLRRDLIEAWQSSSRAGSQGEDVRARRGFRRCPPVTLIARP